MIEVPVMPTLVADDVTAEAAAELLASRVGASRCCRTKGVIGGIPPSGGRAWSDVS
jgi:hypothetical protein